MRKILEERLENAKLDYQRCLEEMNIDDFPFHEDKELKGQIEAYQDCLNLLPPVRTEADIINDLKSLGWKYEKQRLSYEYKFYKGYNVIEICGGDKVIAYEELYYPDDEPNYRPIFIDYETYCLIYELLNLEEENDK